MSALLNSKTVWFYLSNMVALLGSKSFRMKKTYLNLLPIPQISKEQQIKLYKKLFVFLGVL